MNELVAVPVQELVDKAGLGNWEHPANFPIPGPVALGIAFGVFLLGLAIFTVSIGRDNPSDFWPNLGFALYAVSAICVSFTPFIGSVSEEDVAEVTAQYLTDHGYENPVLIDESERWIAEHPDCGKSVMLTPVQETSEATPFHVSCGK